MKLKSEYLLKEIGGTCFLFPVGQHVVNDQSLLQVNTTGQYILNKLMNGISYDELLATIAVKYEAREEDLPILKKDLDDFLNQLREKDALEE